MLLKAKALSLISLFLISTSALASMTTFGNAADQGTYFQVTVDNVDITVSGWSDTRNQNGNDDIIDNANVVKYGNGWGMLNKDESNGCGYSHAADNFTCGQNNAYGDYDFFLLEFSEAVSLTQATYSWVEGSSGQNQVSVVALDENSFNGNLDGMTWAGIKTNHTLASDYSQMQYSSGYYTNFSDNTAGKESTYWLIGALNSVFGGEDDWEGNDAMKLAGVSFNKVPTTTSVPEPSSIAILSLALIGLFSSNRKKQLKHN